MFVSFTLSCQTNIPAKNSKGLALYVFSSREIPLQTITRTRWRVSKFRVNPHFASILELLRTTEITIGWFLGENVKHNRPIDSRQLSRKSKEDYHFSRSKDRKLVNRDFTNVEWRIAT